MKITFHLKTFSFSFALFCSCLKLELLLLFVLPMDVYGDIALFVDSSELFNHSFLSFIYTNLELPYIFMLLLRTIFNFIIFVKRIERVEIVCCHFFIWCWIVLAWMGSFARFFCLYSSNGINEKSLPGKQTFFRCIVIFPSFFPCWMTKWTWHELLKLNKLYLPHQLCSFFVCISFVVINHLIQSHIFKFDVIFHRNVLKINKIMC